MVHFFIRSRWHAGVITPRCARGRAARVGARAAARRQGPRWAARGGVSAGGGGVSRGTDLHRDDESVLLGRPVALLHARVEVVVPSLAALLARPVTCHTPPGARADPGVPSRDRSIDPHHGQKHGSTGRARTRARANTWWSRLSVFRAPRTHRGPRRQSTSSSCHGSRRAAASSRPPEDGNRRPRAAIGIARAGVSRCQGLSRKVDVFDRRDAEGGAGAPAGLRGRCGSRGLGRSPRHNVIASWAHIEGRKMLLPPNQGEHGDAGARVAAIGARAWLDQLRFVPAPEWGFPMPQASRGGHADARQLDEPRDG